MFDREKKTGWVWQWIAWSVLQHAVRVLVGELCHLYVTRKTHLDGLESLDSPEKERVRHLKGSTIVRKILVKQCRYYVLCLHVVSYMHICKPTKWLYQDIYKKCILYFTQKII